jgi:PAS domain S-box-containing protein
VTGLPSKDEAIASLEAYQRRLDNAAGLGRPAYDRLFDDAPAAVALHEIDLDRKVRRVNDRELELLGYRREEVLGKDASSFTVMQETSQRAVERKLAGGGLKPYVRTLARADGTGVTVALVERYLKDSSGRIVGIRTALMPIKT